MHPREAAWKIYVQQTATGSHEALTRLYDESSGLVYGLLVRILDNAADAEEICSDVYFQVWRTAHTFNAERGGATGWLIMLARSRAVDRLRSSATRRKQELNDAGSNEKALRQHCPGCLPDQIVELKRQSELIVAALQKLNTEERAVIELAYFTGMSHTEIAETLGQPLGTIKTRIRGALAKLRSDLLKDKPVPVRLNGQACPTAD